MIIILTSKVIETFFQSHPLEEPVIQIRDVISTRFRYGQAPDNTNKWWNRSDIDWDSKKGD
jgi:hypothetical protein